MVDERAAKTPWPRGWEVRSPRVLAVVFVSYLAISGGCGPSKPSVPLGDVAGTVSLDGNPLPRAVVAFEPQNGRPSYGTTDDDGQYSLRYRGNPWGAIVGRHTVRITTEALLEDSPESAPQIIKERLPKRYHSQSTLTADVVPGKNVIDFALTSD